MGDPDFNELLQAAEQLSADVEGSGELPKVERTLRQVLEASTELWSRVSRSGAQDMQAHLLLGSKGLDLPQLSRKLELLSARKTFEPLEPTPDTDIQSFLKNEKENAILSVIEESHHTCFTDTENWQWQHIKSEWMQEKRKALNALMSSTQGLLNVAIIPESTVMNDTLTSVRTGLDHQEMAYVGHVTEYNKAVVQGIIRPPLVEKFAQSAATLNDKKVDELWEIVKYMVNIPPKASGDPLITRSKPDIQNILIFQARKYLEERYKKYMSTIVMSNLNEARLGGVPGTYPLVRSFVGIRVPSTMLGLEDGEVEGRPFWPLIYYCLRCGDTNAALYCARQAGQAMVELSAILEEVNNSRVKKLSPRLETLVGFQYRRSIRNSTDPFKRAVYCTIGSCDADDEHSEIAKTADDYLWLKLCQIREEEGQDSKSSDKLAYRHLQSLIFEEYGENHYNALEHPHVYAQVLLLTGQFEAAIEFLSRVEKLRVHAVHIAIALNEYNLLGTPQSNQSPLLCCDPGDCPPARRINLARLIMMYVRKFELSDPKEALQYFYFLRNVKGPNGHSLFMECISDLALESRNFDLLLGTMQKDGLPAPGLIHSFYGVQADAKFIIELVASDCERKGLFEEAIKLYDLANNHDKVLTLLTTLLSQVVHLTNVAGSLRWRLHKTADSVYGRYAGQQFNCSSETASMFFVLRDLLTFFDQYHAREYQLALHTIGKSKLIPLSINEVEERVGSFRRLGDEVCRAIPNVLLATMNIIFSQYKKVRSFDGQALSSRFDDSSHDKQIAFLRENARAVTSFAGTVPYRMPGDTNGRLVQMEILMN